MCLGMRKKTNMQCTGSEGIQTIANVIYEETNSFSIVCMRVFPLPKNGKMCFDWSGKCVEGKTKLDLTKMFALEISLNKR